MALDLAIGNSSWSCSHRLSVVSTFSAECSAFYTSVPRALLKSTAWTAETVAMFATEGWDDLRKKGAVSKRVLHSLNERELGGLTSAAEQIKATVLRPSRDLSELAALPPEDAATLRLMSKSPTSNTVGEDSDLVVGSRTSPPKLLRVAVDVDEVLGSFLSSLNMFMAERHGLYYNLSEYNVYDFMKVWRCSQAEANDRVHAFFKSEHFKDGILPIPGAYESLLRLADFCHLVVVTSRQDAIKKQTLDWIERHYSGIFADVHFGNHFALEGEPRPKSEICRSIGAQLLIDDNPRYAVECANHGIEVFLFDHNNSYPWSKTAEGPIHSLITRVQTWHEVEKFLSARFQERR